MSPHRPSRPPVRALLVALMVLPPFFILVSLSWLKHLPEALVFLLTGIAATLTVVASFALSILHDRRIDEWSRSNARFASQWGWTAGASLVALLLALPPFRDLIVAWAAGLVRVPSPNQALVLVSFTFGFMTVVFTQLVCVALLATAWAFWKSRPARELS
jgi:hypothetical protein